MSTTKNPPRELDPNPMLIVRVRANMGHGPFFMAYEVPAHFLSVGYLREMGTTPESSAIQHGNFLGADQGGTWARRGVPCPDYSSAPMAEG